MKFISVNEIKGSESSMATLPQLYGIILIQSLFKIENYSTIY